MTAGAFHFSTRYTPTFSHHSGLVPLVPAAFWAGGIQKKPVIPGGTGPESKKNLVISGRTSPESKKAIWILGQAQNDKFLNHH
jgi:hypothetical protein